MKGRACWLGAAGVLVLKSAAFALGGPFPPAKGRARPILVSLEKGASWRDMAFLAALPASARLNGGIPLVLALPPGGEVRPEAADFLRRLEPKEVFLLGPSKGKRRPRPAWALPLRASSAQGAALVLARTFWNQAPRAVLCGKDDYPSGLAASVLAARLGAPLLFAGPGREAGRLQGLLKRLGVRKLLLVGGGISLPAKFLPGVKRIRLQSPLQVLSWMEKQGLPVRYLAAANPEDRKMDWDRCISLAAPLLAAGRGGAVAILSFQTRWKAPFPSKPLKDPPKVIPGPFLWKWGGRAGIGTKSLPFLLGARKGRLPHLIRFDLDGDGDFRGRGEGPFRACDVLGIEGKRWVLSLRPKGRRKGPVTLELTWPPADLVRKRLEEFERLLPGESFFLCLTGPPQSIPPFFIRKNPGNLVDLLSDMPYAQADPDPFSEVPIGRFVAEDAASGTLQACRSLFYEALLDPSWDKRASLAAWARTPAPLLRNAGFEGPYLHEGTAEIGPWSPAARSAILLHNSHSWWLGLGGKTVSWDTQVLFAPCLVESGGCLSAALDRDTLHRSVALRLQRNGAVAFVGNVREGIGQSGHFRLAFLNGVLAGKTLGEAYLYAQNSMKVVMLEKGQRGGWGYRYQFYNAALYGDPALRIHLPSPPAVAPARVEAKGSILTVRAPSKWWKVEQYIPKDWKYKESPKIYTYRGAGVGVDRHWDPRHHRDQEDLYFLAAYRTRRKIKGFTQLGSPPPPLGWTGRYFIDRHADGSRTLLWRVKFLQFDMATGRIEKKIDSFSFRIKNISKKR